MRNYKSWLSNTELWNTPHGDVMQINNHPMHGICPSDNFWPANAGGDKYGLTKMHTARYLEFNPVSHRNCLILTCSRVKTLQSGGGACKCESWGAATGDIAKPRTTSRTLLREWPGLQSWCKYEHCDIICEWLTRGIFKNPTKNCNKQS